MVLVYGLLRMVAVALTKLASWRHARAMKQLDVVDAQYREIENKCKAEEVAVGRPVDFASQFKLMREYEKREKANERWKRAATKLKKRKRLQETLAGFSGRKVPYSFGLVDMAIVLHALDYAYSKNFEWSMVTDYVASLMS